MEREALAGRLRAILEQTPTADIHTHLYSPAFGGLLLWGLDELLTYHYLVAELFRYRPELSYEEFWGLPKPRQAELVWDALFVRNTPVSEAARGVVTTLHRLGLDAGDRDLGRLRRYFDGLTPGQYVDRVLGLANVKWVVMTNDPLDPAEQAVWEAGGPRDERFRAALRLDGVLNDFPGCAAALGAQGFRVGPTPDAGTLAAVRDFLGTWIDRMRPVYLAVSLPPTFRMDDGSARARLLAGAVLPVAGERGLPLALMIGVRKRVNPALRDAGDSVGRADVGVVEDLARTWPGVRFLVTMLSRENQHELCVAARKFGNLLVFGCWWFLNNPSIVREITAERLELLGLSMIPQHSDARVLDQLIYKWAHTREVLAGVLAERYAALGAAGWRVSEADLRRDAERLLGGAQLERS